MSGFVIPRVKPADTIVLLDGLCERFNILLLQGNAKGLYKSQNNKTLVTPRACTDLMGTKMPGYSKSLRAQVSFTMLGIVAIL